jgi:DNA polymerase IV
LNLQRIHTIGDLGRFPVDILKYLLQLSEIAGRLARRYGVSGKTVNFYVRYADFYSSWGKQQTLPNPINQRNDIYKVAIDILDTVELQQPVRLLGVRLTNLRYQVAQQHFFFYSHVRVEHRYPHL